MDSPLVYTSRMYTIFKSIKATHEGARIETGKKTPCVMQQLAHATQQNQYQHLFNNIPTYDGTNKDKFFHWLDKLQGACLMRWMGLYARNFCKVSWEG